MFGLLVSFYHLFVCIRAVASPTQPGRAKKILGGAKYLSSFLKFELKNRRKSAEESKHNIYSLLLLCYFSKQ